VRSPRSVSRGDHAVVEVVVEAERWVSRLDV
jgi:hypothetical protein